MDTVFSALNELPQMDEVTLVDDLPDADAFDLVAKGIVQAELADTYREDMATLLRHPQLQRARYLRLFEMDDYDEALRELKNCLQLEEIHLVGFFDVTHAIEHLAGCPRLKAVMLSDSEISLACIPALRRIPHLKRAHLGVLPESERIMFGEQLPGVKVYGTPQDSAQRD
jgi:hypothetical protein